MTAITFFAGVATGILLTIAALWVLRRELALYRRATGRTIDFTHRSRP